MHMVAEVGQQGNRQDWRWSRVKAEDLRVRASDVFEPSWRRRRRCAPPQICQLKSRGWFEVAQSKGQDVADIVQFSCGTALAQDQRRRCCEMEMLLEVDRAEASGM